METIDVSKGQQVRDMFDAIAGRYDLMNRVMTMGQDQKWRRFVIKMAGDPGRGRVLDLACGTGDIASLMHRVYPAAGVIGSDFSWNMLQVARQRFSGHAISWQACDANRLPFADNVFSAVSFGYLLRNVDDPLRVLKEVHRILGPGGRVVCLDTTPPERNLLYPFIILYFRFGIPLLGKCIARDKSAYSYLTGSTMGFATADELAAIFKEAGFERVGYKKFMMGTIAVHWGQKA